MLSGRYAACDTLLQKTSRKTHSSQLSTFDDRKKFTTMARLASEICVSIAVGEHPFERTDLAPRALLMDALQVGRRGEK